MAETKTSTKASTTKKKIELTGVYSKLVAARVALGKSKLTKSGENSYSHYKYFQLKDFLPRVNELFADLGLHSHFEIVPHTIATKKTILKDENGLDKTIAEEPIITTIAKLTITDVETKETETYAMEVQPLEVLRQQNSYQAAGGRSTYYKRYLYRDALEIEEDDDIEPTTGAKETQYTPAPTQEVTPYSFQAPTSNTIQEAVVSPAPNVGQQVKVTTNGDVESVSAPDGLLSVESKEEVMNLVNGKGLDAFEIINNFCANNNTTPADLLESHKQPLIDYINSL